MEQIQKTAQTLRNSCTTKARVDAGKLRKRFIIHVFHYTLLVLYIYFILLFIPPLTDKLK